MTLGQRVAVMRDGRIQQVDAPQNLYNEPANLFVAAFIGSPSMNLVEATVDGRHRRVRRLPPRARPGAPPRPRRQGDSRHPARELRGRGVRRAGASADRRGGVGARGARCGRPRHLPDRCASCRRRGSARPRSTSRSRASSPTTSAPSSTPASTPGREPRRVRSIRLAVDPGAVPLLRSRDGCDAPRRARPRPRDQLVAAACESRGSRDGRRAGDTFTRALRAGSRRLVRGRLRASGMDPRARSRARRRSRRRATRATRSRQNSTGWPSPIDAEVPGSLACARASSRGRRRRPGGSRRSPCPWRERGRSRPSARAPTASGSICCQKRCDGSKFTPMLGPAAVAQPQHRRGVVDDEAGMRLDRDPNAMVACELRRFEPVRDDALAPLPLERLRVVVRPGARRPSSGGESAPTRRDSRRR